MIGNSQFMSPVEAISAQALFTGAPFDQDIHLSNTLQICGCGRPHRIQHFVAGVLSRLEEDDVEAEVLRNPFVAADLVLHWLYEIDLLEDHEHLDTAELSPTAIGIARSKDVDRLHDIGISASADHILFMLRCLARAGKGASLHSHLATAVPHHPRAAASILLAYLCAKRFMAVDAEGRSHISEKGYHLLSHMIEDA